MWGQSPHISAILNSQNIWILNHLEFLFETKEFSDFHVKFTEISRNFEEHNF